MDELGRAERPERVRHELAFAIAVHGANGWAREGLTSFVNGRADGGVEGRDAALDRSVGIRLQLDEIDEDEARVLVDGKDNVAVAGNGVESKSDSTYFPTSTQIWQRTEDNEHQYSTFTGAVGQWRSQQPLRLAKDESSRSGTLTFNGTHASERGAAARKVEWGPALREFENFVGSRFTPACNQGIS